MDELSAYRSRIGLFAYTAYKKSSHGREPKQRQRKPRPVTKQTSKRRTTTEVTVEPERRHRILALVLLLVSIACSIERYGYVSDISYYASVDWLTGSDAMSLGHGCSYPGNCYYRSTVSSKQDLPFLGITGVISLDSFISDCEQNFLNSSVLNKEVPNYNYIELNYRDITSTVSEEPVCTVNSYNNYTGLNYRDLISPLSEEPVCTVNFCDNYAVLNYRDITSPVSEEPVCTINSYNNYTVLNYRDLISPLSEEPVCTVNFCDNYAVLNYRDITSPVSEEPVCTINSCDNYTVLNYRNIASIVSGEPFCTVNSCDNYTVLNYRDITSTVSEEPVCTVNSCDNYTVLNYRNITSPVSGEPVCTVHSCDNYTMLNYRDITSLVSGEPVCTINSCDNCVVLNYTNLLSPVREEPPCAIRTCGPGSCLYLLGNECGNSCYGNPNIYTNIWRTLPPSTVSYDSIIDNYANRWMILPPSTVSCDSIIDNYESRWVTLQPLAVSYMHERFSDSVLISENRHQRTCSFLIGNSGSHAYNGNPHMHGGEEEDIKLVHCEMVNRLMGMVSPNIGDAWDKMKKMAKLYLTDIEIIKANNIIKICDALEENGIIQYGKYEALTKIFSESGLMNCCKIVDEYSQKIKDIRSKPSSSLSRKRTREASPLGSESHADTLPKKMHISAGEDIRKLQGDVDTLALHAAGLGTSATLYSRDVAAPTQHKMSPGTSATLYSRDVAALTQHKMSPGTSATLCSWDVAALTQHKMSPGTSATLCSWDVAALTQHKMSPGTSATLYSRDVAAPTQHKMSPGTSATLYSQDVAAPTQHKMSPGTSATLCSQIVAALTKHKMSPGTSATLYSRDVAALTQHKMSPGKVTLVKQNIGLVFGNIEQEQTDVIVCEVDSSLNIAASSGAAKGLFAVGGKTLMAECKSWFPDGIKPGKVIAINGGNLKCKKLYLISLPVVLDEKKKNETDEATDLKKILLNAISDIANKAVKENVTSLAIPAIGIGTMDIPSDDVARIIFDSFGEKRMQLKIVLRDKQAMQTFLCVGRKMYPSVDMELYVENWKKEDKLCYVTTGIKHVVQKISSDEVYFHCVVGVPASGKSTAIRHAALHLKEKSRFNIYVITRPEEFFSYLDKGIKQIFLQEDVIGEYFVDKEMLRLWDKYNDSIKSCLDKNTKFLSSLRVQLYLDQELKGRKYMFNNEHHVTNLSDKLFKLDVSEMKEMLRHYLEFYKVANPEALIEEIWPSGQSESTTGQDFDKCFPLMCRVFSEKKAVRVNPRKYFSDPLPVLQDIFQQINNNNKPQFCGLLLCGITELKDEYFSSLHELSKRPNFNYIIESLDLDPKVDLLKIKEALQKLDGVYISHIGNRYTFLHSIFQNIVTYLYDDKYYVFKYATRDFITSRVRLFDKLATDDQYVLVYGEECVDLLVSRMIHELKSSDDTKEAAWFIVDNCNINNEALISRLVTQLYDHHDVSITQDMTDMLFGVSMLAVCKISLSPTHIDVTSRPQYQLLASLITRHDCSRRLVVGRVWRYPIRLSVHRRALPVTNLLLTKPEVSLDVLDKYNRCVLHWY